MTIIAFDGVSMAADRAAWHGQIAVRCDKVFKLYETHLTVLKPPVLIGICGVEWYARAVADWVKRGGAVPQPCPVEDKDCSVALVVDQRKHIYRVTTPHLALVRVPTRRASLGAAVGMAMADGAMEFGASARQAVQLCIARTDIAALGVDVLRL